MKSWIATGLCIAFLVPASALAQSSGAEGNWARGDGNARVKIAPCGSDLCATNTWIKDTSDGEEVGDRLIMTVAPEGEGRLVGQASDPKRDRTYRIEITISGNRLFTRGCILGGVVCKSVDWTRVD